MNEQILGNLREANRSKFRLDLLKEAVAINKASTVTFNMSDWLKETDCSTEGCFIGCYILGKPDCGLILAQVSTASKTLKIFTVVTSGETRVDFPLQIIANFFGIGLVFAEYLFDPIWYDNDEDRKNKELVIERVENFIAIVEAMANEH